MNILKRFPLLIALMGLVALTSCDKAAEELLDAMGVNTFKEDDTIFENKSQENVASKTITVAVGSKVMLYIGDIKTKKAKTYEKAKWSSDDIEVATVTPDKGNGTIVSVRAEGMALISVSDVEGKMLTVNIEATADINPGEGEYGYDDDYNGDDDNGGYDDDDNGNQSSGIFDSDTQLFFDYVDEGPIVTAQTVDMVLIGGHMNIHLVNGSTSEELTDGYEDVTWTTSDEQVVRLLNTTGANNFISLLNIGTATVTATDREGNSLWVTIVVREPDTFDYDCAICSSTNGHYEVIGSTYKERPGNYIDVYVGDRETCQPYGFQHITWSTSDENIASLNTTKGNDIHIEMGDDEGTTIICARDETGQELRFTLQCTYNPYGSRSVRIRRMK